MKKKKKITKEIINSNSCMPRKSMKIKKKTNRQTFTIKS